MTGESELFIEEGEKRRVSEWRERGRSEMGESIGGMVRWRWQDVRDEREKEGKHILPEKQ